MERVVIIYCPRVLLSILRRRFDYITLRFCGILLGFVEDCTITILSMVIVYEYEYGSLR